MSRNSIASDRDMSPHEKFETFVIFFSELFTQPDVLQSANCRESYKEYVPHYYRNLFGPNANPNSSKHLKWYRRLSALFSLPSGSTILDYGGGYGMDSIFLASLGYEVLFYEITPHHIAVAQWLSDRYSERFGPLAIRFVLAGVDPEPRAIDAVMANEVAHHIEPTIELFRRSAAMVHEQGRLFLLEPNFMNPLVQMFFFRVRGFRTTKTVRDSVTGETRLWGNEHIRPIFVWNRIARSAGFEVRNITFVAPWPRATKKAGQDAVQPTVENLPIVRDLLCSHLAIEYVKT